MSSSRPEWQSFETWIDGQLSDPTTRAEWYANALPRALALAAIRKRSENGWTQTELGRELGMTQAQVSRLESAEHMPSLATLQRVAHVLGLQIEMTIGPREDDRRPAPRAIKGAVVETTDQLVVTIRDADHPTRRAIR